MRLYIEKAGWHPIFGRGAANIDPSKVKRGPVRSKKGNQFVALGLRHVSHAHNLPDDGKDETQNQFKAHYKAAKHCFTAAKLNDHVEANPGSVRHQLKADKAGIRASAHSNQALQPYYSSFSKINKLNRSLEKAEAVPGGLASGKPDSDFDPEALAEGMKVELEHTDSKKIAREIAKDHLTEHKDYYQKLKKMEGEMEKGLFSRSVKIDPKKYHHPDEKYKFANHWVHADYHFLEGRRIKGSDPKKSQKHIKEGSRVASSAEVQNLPEPDDSVSHIKHLANWHAKKATSYPEGSVGRETHKKLSAAASWEGAASHHPKSDITSYVQRVEGSKLPTAGHPFRTSGVVLHRGSIWEDWVAKAEGEFRGGDPEEMRIKKEEKEQEMAESGEMEDDPGDVEEPDSSEIEEAEQEAQDKKDEMGLSLGKAGPSISMGAAEISPVDTGADYVPRDINGEPAEHQRGKRKPWVEVGPPRRGKNQDKVWSEVLGCKVPMSGNPRVHLRRFTMAGATDEEIDKERNMLARGIVSKAKMTPKEKKALEDWEAHKKEWQGEPPEHVWDSDFSIRKRARGYRPPAIPHYRKDIKSEIAVHGIDSLPSHVDGHLRSVLGKNWKGDLRTYKEAEDSNDWDAVEDAESPIKDAMETWQNAGRGFHTIRGAGQAVLTGDRSALSHLTKVSDMDHPNGSSHHAAGVAGAILSRMPLDHNLIQKHYEQQVKQGNPKQRGGGPPVLLRESHHAPEGVKVGDHFNLPCPTSFSLTSQGGGFGDKALMRMKLPSRGHSIPTKGESEVIVSGKYKVTGVGKKGRTTVYDVEEHNPEHTPGGVKKALQDQFDKFFDSMAGGLSKAKKLHIWDNDRKSKPGPPAIPHYRDPIQPKLSVDPERMPSHVAHHVGSILGSNWKDHIREYTSAIDKSTDKYKAGSRGQEAIDGIDDGNPVKRAMRVWAGGMRKGKPAYGVSGFHHIRGAGQAVLTGDRKALSHLSKVSDKDHPDLVGGDVGEHASGVAAAILSRRPLDRDVLNKHAAYHRREYGVYRSQKTPIRHLYRESYYDPKDVKEGDHFHIAAPTSFTTRLSRPYGDEFGDASLMKMKVPSRGFSLGPHSLHDESEVIVSGHYKVTGVRNRSDGTKIYHVEEAEVPPGKLKRLKKAMEEEFDHNSKFDNFFGGQKKWGGHVKSDEADESAPQEESDHDSKFDDFFSVNGHHKWGSDKEDQSESQQQQEQEPQEEEAPQQTEPEQPEQVESEQPEQPEPEADETAATIKQIISQIPQMDREQLIQVSKTMWGEDSEFDDEWADDNYIREVVTGSLLDRLESHELGEKPKRVRAAPDHNEEQPEWD